MAVLFEPQVSQVGEGHTIRFKTGSGVPAASDLVGVQANVGDVMFNVNPSVGSSLLDRCVVAGNPGTWEMIGTDIVNATVSLTNAQVKATHSAPIAIIPAQGAGTLIEVISMVLENVFLTAAYANGGALALYYGTDATGVLATATAAATFLTSPVANQVIMVAGALGSALASATLNTGLVFANPTADFITGAGSMLLKVRYRVHSGLV